MLVITELVLHKFKRFALNNIETFTINPTAIVQLLLGTNGSGKSSLMKELSPLPADPSDYAKDGSKTIKLTKDNNFYILISTFSPTNKFSFSKNDAELNPGGTVTVFKELVKQEFGITTEIHELLVGEELFHSMSPARRREWFTRLSDTNYDYALSVYNRLKERSRDISGALKLAKKHYVTESAKVISEAEEAKLRNDVELTFKELNLLIEQSAPLDKPISSYELDKNTKLEELTKLSNKLLRMRLMAPYGTHPYGLNPNSLSERDDCYEPIKQGFNSIEEIETFIYELSHKITSAEVLVNKAVDEHTKISETIKILVKTGNEGIAVLHDKASNIGIDKNNILGSRKLQIEGVTPDTALNAFDSVYDVMANIALVIPSNEDKRFSQARITELNSKLLVDKDTKIKKTSDLAKVESQRIHLESHKSNGDITCPKCKHVWIPGYSEQHLETLIQSICSIEQEITLLSKEIENTENEIQDMREYGELYRDYSKCIGNWPVLKPLWDYLIEGNYIIHSPRKIVSILDTFRADLDIELTAKKLDDEIMEVLHLIKLSEQLGDASLTELQSDLIDHTVYVETKTAELGSLRSIYASHVQYKKQLLEAIELDEKIKILTIHAEEANTSMIEMIRRDTLNHCVRQLQSSLALKENTLHAAVLQKGIIDDLHKQIERLVLEEEAAKILVTQLSPNDGLIAEGLLGFIKVFVGQMNSLLKKTWSYPLHIEDCGISSSELDYKFPLVVQDNAVTDVKFGSTGMKEIINTIFKIVAMQHLGLANTPIYLDEPGSSMDPAHRTAVSNLIKSIMDTGKYSQLFLISHDYSIYGSFPNIECCVLDARNIVVPKIYNSHVEIS